MFASCFDPGRGAAGKAPSAPGVCAADYSRDGVLVLLPAIGLSVDAGIMYLVQSRLSAAVDAASLAGARALARGIDDNAQHSNAEATATTYFNANFPTGYFAITNVHVTNLAATDSTFMRSVTSTASVDLPFHLPARAGGQSHYPAGFGQGDAARCQRHDRDGPVEIARRQRRLYAPESGRREVRG